jgi:hypothetical protein
MSQLGAKILSLAPKQVSRIAYGVMASATTVSIEGAVTAVTVPQLASAGVLVSGDFVAIQMVGADSLIIGKVAAPAYPTRLAYETMASATTVSIDGGTAATVPQLASAGVLEAGDDVAIQVVGATALIIGKVGASARTEWASFTPTWTGITVGNGTNAFVWRYTDEQTLEVRGLFTFGSTSSVTTAIRFTIPDGRSQVGERDLGTMWLIGGSGSNFLATCQALGSLVFLHAANLTNLSATNPFTWSTGDMFNVVIRIQV